MSTAVDVRAIEDDAVALGPAELLEYLVEHLGQQTTAYIIGLKSPQMFARWEAGARPSQRSRLRLRWSYHVTRILIEAYDEETAEAWLFGANSRLDDEAPAWMLRNAGSVDAVRSLVPAAKAFARIPRSR